MKYRSLLTLSSTLVVICIAGYFLHRSHRDATHALPEARASERSDVPVAEPEIPADFPAAPARAIEPPVIPTSLREWSGRWQAAEASEKVALLAEGKALAAERATAMIALMRSTPDEALAQALSWNEWFALPAEVRAMVEEPFSITADYSVRSDCRPAEELRENPRHLTWLTSAEGSLKIHPSSAWRRVTSKNALPVQGIRLAGEAVLHGGIVRVLDPADTAAVVGLFPVKPGRADGLVTALVGGEQVRFTNEGEANTVGNELAKTLEMNGPRTVRAGLGVAFASGGRSGGNIAAAAEAASLAWSTTPKRVLAMRLDFPDLTGTPFSQAELQTILQETSGQLSDMSYTKVSFSAIDVTPTVLRMSQASSNYTADTLATEAKSLASTAGFPTADYDFFMYSLRATSQIGGAFADLGGDDQWYTDQNYPSQRNYRVFVHENGHNLGVIHANFWVGALAGGDWTERDSYGTSWGPVAHREYGDIFDIMGTSGDYGGGQISNGHFSISSKSYLGWISPAQVTTASTNGTYRVYRFDHKATTGGPLALTFATGNGQKVWVGLRRNFSNNPLLSNGAYVVWANLPFEHRLIDCTPVSRNDRIPGKPYYIVEDDLQDSALPTGMTWATPDGSVKLTNLGAGGIAPNEYLDLHLEFVSSGPAATELFTTAGATTPGLTGSYYDENLSQVDEPDWTASRTPSGVRVDSPVDLPSWDFGSRAEVGVTGGTDADWDFFSVQWDGYLRVNRAARIATRSYGSSRVWVDVNGNGTFENATELLDNQWGDSQGLITGTFSGSLPPGIYKIRTQYEASDYDNSFQFVIDDVDGDFDLFQDQAQNAYGLTASFVNSSLRAVSSQDSFVGSQTISGTRADPIPLFWDNGMGTRSTMGITDGTNSNWQNYSVQYDGWLRVNRATRFLPYGADGTRFWIDLDGNDSYGTTVPEFNTGNWGSNGVSRFGPFSDFVQPGLYRVRIQHEQDTDGWNRWAFAGQNNLQTSPGQGIRLEGGYVSAPGGPTISGDFTVEAWVRPADASTPVSIVSTRNDFGFEIKLYDGNYVLGNIGTDSSWLNTNAGADYQFRPGEWYHIAYCVGGGGYDVFVNGWKAGTGNYSGTPLLCDATHPIRIGSYNGVADHFKGDIDEVRIWDVKRTGEQIAANFHRTVRSDSPGLASCWRLDETSGSVVADITGARNGSYIGTVDKVALDSPVFGAVNTLYVTKNDDNGPGSLNDTIAYANTLPGPVTITITVTGVVSVPTTGNGFPVISGQLVINGPGSGLLTLSGTDSGGQSGGIFKLMPGASLTLRNVTLADATLDGAAAAVHNNGGTVLLEDCVIGNCTSGSALGGACYSSGSFTARRCTFGANTVQGGNGVSKVGGGGGGGGAAAMGGAIFSEGTSLILEDCFFGGNQAVGGNGGTGGNYYDSFNLSGGNGGSPNPGSGGISLGDNGGNGGFGGGGGGGASGSSFPMGQGGSGGQGAGGGGGGGLLFEPSGGGGPGGNFGGGAGGAGQYEFFLSQFAGGGGGGGGAGLGGAVYLRAGSATITRCTFISNTVNGGIGGVGSSGANNGYNGSSFGGAIFNEGLLDVSASTFQGNTSSAGGGALCNNASASIASSTFANNSGDYGGAINNSATLGLTHCTVSGNTASFTGGGIDSGFSDSSMITVANSIVAGNTAAYGDDFNNRFGAVTRVGASIVQDYTGIAATGAGSISNADPLLAPLDDYGGPTKTMALMPGSPARDTAVGSTITADQRGFQIVGPVDIGAYEAGSPMNYNAYIWESLPSNTSALQRADTFDFDGDGASNGNEWLALTDPADNASYFRITRSARAGSDMMITFPSVAGRIYRFESTTNLTDWTLVLNGGIPLTATGTGESLNVPLGPFPATTALFVRVCTGP